VSDFYHDDPVEELSSERKKPKALFGSVLLLFAGGLFLNTTLAANINLNSGGRVEFGQGASVTTACSQGSSLTITPQSEFRNVAGAGAYYVKSIKVSGIPSSCNGKDFNISLYDNVADSGPLPIFETSTAVATVWNNSGTFVEGYKGTGTTITSGSGTFTVTFNSPVALSSDAQKITVESTEHKSWTCQDGKRPCAVGETGPGGGIVFYEKASGFNCGPTWTATCTNLEVAPSGWNGQTDPTARWITSNYYYDQVNGTNGMISDDQNLNYSSLGRGYINSLAIRAKDNNTLIAAGLAREYRGGGLSDWYLPNFSEMNTLCHWNVGTTPASGIRCENVSSGRNNARFGAQLSGMQSALYWTSSEKAYYAGGSYNFQEPENYGNNKNEQLRVRPVRAFS